MELCAQLTRHHLTWCVLPGGHNGGHRGVYAIGWPDPAARQMISVAWSEDHADPIVVGTT